MPEYLAPGVYVEETSFRAKSIEGVGTSTTAFVGATRRGPVGGTPELITSFGDFERIYGGVRELEFTNATKPSQRVNYVAQAVRNYFDNGGARLYVARAFTAPDGGDGRAVGKPDVVENAAAEKRARWVARSPGAAGGTTARPARVRLQQVKLPGTATALATAADGTLVATSEAGAPLLVRAGGAWNKKDGTAQDLGALAAGTTFSVLTAAAVITDADGQVSVIDDLGFDSHHPRYIGEVLGESPSRRRDQLENLVGLSIGKDLTAFDLHDGLFKDADTKEYTFSGGSDGKMPVASDYATALAELLKLEDVAIVAAPGHSALGEFAAIQQELLKHVETLRAYRIAVLDSQPDQALSEVKADRAKIDSTRAALYYPWVVVANPDPSSPKRELTLPPSGFLCGIYARNDIERGVAKTPANEVVLGALRFESDVNFAEQGSLNPLGINCLRYLSGRGYRVWGGRTASSDPEWKYVNVRRYFLYLEASIDRGTQWAVFENNGERLWANIRETVEGFLYNEWVSGNLLGGSPKEAFFVRCDRSTMTQNDLDNGRLICLIGVAVLKPAEFVIFRIGQKTAEARS